MMRGSQTGDIRFYGQKNREFLRKDIKMICKDLFKNGDTVFVPAEENLANQESQINGYANYHGLMVDIKLGVWVNSFTTEAERVLRIVLIGKRDAPRYKSRPQLDAKKIKKREEKIDLIKKLLKEGKSETEIAKVFGCSKQAINQFIRYNFINKGED